MYEWSEENSIHKRCKAFPQEWIAKCFKVTPRTIGLIVNKRSYF